MDRCVWLRKQWQTTDFEALTLVSPTTRTADLTCEHRASCPAASSAGASDARPSQVSARCHGLVDSRRFAHARGFRWMVVLRPRLFADDPVQQVARPAHQVRCLATTCQSGSPRKATGIEEDLDAPQDQLSAKPCSGLGLVFLIVHVCLETLQTGTRRATRTGTRRPPSSISTRPETRTSTRNIRLRLVRNATNFHLVLRVWKGLASDP